MHTKTSGGCIQCAEESCIVRKIHESLQCSASRGIRILGGIEFSEWCQGKDWEQIVDLDTESLIKCAEEKRRLFCRPLDELENPLLFMGSKEDDMIRKDFLAEYQAIMGLTGAKICVYDTGFHPAIVSNAEQAAVEIKLFLVAD